jgi:hypothetical protein
MFELKWKTCALKVLGFAAAIAFVASASQAQEKYLEACESDREQYCSNVVPGNGRLASCLYAHTQVITDDCFDATSEISSQLELFYDLIVTVTAACADDLDMYCSDAEAGGGQKYQCLKEHLPKLSPICSAQINSTFSR